MNKQQFWNDIYGTIKDKTLIQYNNDALILHYHKYIHYTLIQLYTKFKLLQRNVLTINF